VERRSLYQTSAKRNWAQTVWTVARQLPRAWAWVLVLVFLSSVPQTLAMAWGSRGHQAVNAAAVENLPEPMRSYFRTWRIYLVEHASDPDQLAREDPSERPHHYTEVEAYDSRPFRNFHHLFVEEKASAPIVPQHGDSIWQIERYALRLTESLRRHRWNEARENAVFVAHYAADLTQPLHTIVNYDGQLSGQSGIHARFETELVNALADRWTLLPQPRTYLADLRGAIFHEMIVSYTYRNVVFAADRIAVTDRSYLDPQYFSSFTRLLGPLAKKRLEAGACFVSSLWYTAWVRAGKPAMKASRALGTIGGASARN
jgi:hypothetical protein